MTIAPTDGRVDDAGRASRPVRQARRAVRRLRIGLEGRHSGWTAPLLVWLGSRLVSTLFLATMFVVATASGWTFASHRTDPTFFTFSGSWDAWQYRTIATAGYPRSLPVDADGNVRPNAWAFLPVFPWVVRALMTTGLSFWVAGFLVALLCGAGACVLLHRLIRVTGCSRRALRGVALFAFGPLGFLLQVSYAESMFLLLVFGALLALVRQRYWLVTLLGVTAAFTRPGILALAVALAVHLVVRWVRDARGGPVFPWSSRIGVAASGLVVAAAGLAWPFVAGVVTGRSDAYLATELSWWVGFVGRREFAPLTPWFVLAGRWLGVAGIALVVVVLAGFVVFLTRRSVRAVGPDVLGFVAGYGFYLVAVFLPQQSLARLLLPMAPLLGSDAFVRTRRRTVGWIAVGIVLQPVAIVFLWFLGYP